jgi:hypothetical protein
VDPYSLLKIYLVLEYWASIIPANPHSFLNFSVFFSILNTLPLPSGLWGLGEGRGFTQYSRGLSLLISTKTLVPNKALLVSFYFVCRVDVSTRFLHQWWQRTVLVLYFSVLMFMSLLYEILLISVNFFLYVCTIFMIMNPMFGYFCVVIELYLQFLCSWNDWWFACRKQGLRTYNFAADVLIVQMGATQGHVLNSINF